MNNEERLQLCRQLAEELEFPIRFEKERCNTHSQRNAAMHLIRVVTEALRQELRLVKAAPVNETDEIPF